MDKSLYWLPSKVVNMSHLTQEQRYTISEMTDNGYRPSEIAKIIGKHKSTIGRELKRNCDERNGSYRYILAQRKYEERQKRKRKRIKFSPEVKAYVEQKLQSKWSPEQISKTKAPEGMELVSHERIYQHILSDKKQGGSLWKHLRRKRKYKRRCITEDRRGKISNAKSIHQRPAEVEQRVRCGDLEVDLIIGANHKGAILTINDRKTGVLTMRLLKSKTSKHVASKIVSALIKQSDKIHTITSDNGKEFADHEYVSKKLGIDFYFADPYSSWQRGSNENLNGLIRQYFPKKTNFETLTHYDVKRVEKELNNRPRKRFDYKSPLEIKNSLTEVAFVT